MSWVTANSKNAFLVTPDNRLLWGEWHVNIVLEQLDQLPEDLRERTALIDFSDTKQGEDDLYEIVRELLKRGWAKGRWVAKDELSLGLWETDDQRAESILRGLSPEILSVKMLYVEFFKDNTGYDLMVGPGEDALDVYLKRGQRVTWRTASRREYSWDDVRAAMASLNVNSLLIYYALGGNEDLNNSQAWEWIEYESDPTEVMGFLTFEFGQELSRMP